MSKDTVLATKKDFVKHTGIMDPVPAAPVHKANKQKPKVASNSENYAEIAGLNSKQFKAFIYLIATAINFEDADLLISKYYPKFEEKRKLNFLVKHFNIYGIFGKNLNDKIRYLFVVKSILRAARNMGTNFVIKK